MALGILDFSNDTVAFDTIFTTFQSPSERLLVFNNTDHDILISQVSFEKGSSTEFSMIFDGLEMQEITDYEIPKGDSLHIFIKMRGTEKDEFSTDRLVFRVGDETPQRIVLQAYLVDAYFWPDTTLVTPVTTFKNDKPHVIDGVLSVPEGYRLEIPAGTQIHFTPRKDADYNLESRIDVYGKLIVWGEKGNEAVFQQTRLEEDYVENPGQWRGIRFLQPSKDNIITHAIIKNALIGIEVQQPPSAAMFKPKVQLNEVEVRNMAAYGIMGIGYGLITTQPLIYARNTLVHNCQTNDVLIFAGGKYQFSNCTFTNYSIDFNRSSAIVGINNYDEGAGLAFEVDARFKNCIIYGSEEDEVILDDAGLGGYTADFDHCIVRAKEVVIPGSANTISQSNDFIHFQDPTNVDPSKRNYRLSEISPAFNTAVQDLLVLRDLDEKLRDLTPDIGCYEF